jgi:hypothetical protein
VVFVCPFQLREKNSLSMVVEVRGGIVDGPCHLNCSLDCSLRLLVKNARILSRHTSYMNNVIY